jgi:uncharacterized Fe-S cluster-containing radical SAM superfamily protein
MNIHAPATRKFQDPDVTAKGEERAQVPLMGARTLWFNTGTLCNIECVNCYIDSSPTNDALVYITAAEVTAYLDQIADRDWPVAEIGFTGGEPFMNPQIITMIDDALSRGFEVLVLTNAMKPMMRPRVQQGLLAAQARHGEKLTLRVSLDHYAAAKNDAIRGAGSFDDALVGLAWLRDAGIKITIAGRTLWHEDDATARAGYAALFAAEGLAVDADDPAQTVLFPEMDETVDVPEITTACWGILNKRPADVMCATSRMVVRRKGEAHARVVACTLLPHAPDFDLGESLAEAERPVRLNHPHCAKFCVLGGASCSL